MKLHQQQNHRFISPVHSCKNSMRYTLKYPLCTLLYVLAQKSLKCVKTVWHRSFFLFYIFQHSSAFPEWTWPQPSCSPAPPSRWSSDLWMLQGLTALKAFAQSPALSAPRCLTPTSSPSSSFRSQLKVTASQDSLPSLPSTPHHVGQVRAQASAQPNISSGSWPIKSSGVKRWLYQTWCSSAQHDAWSLRGTWKVIVGWMNGEPPHPLINNWFVRRSSSFQRHHTTERLPPSLSPSTGLGRGCSHLHRAGSLCSLHPPPHVHGPSRDWGPESQQRNPTNKPKPKRDIKQQLSTKEQPHLQTPLESIHYQPPFLGSKKIQ